MSSISLQINRDSSGAPVAAFGGFSALQLGVAAQFSSVQIQAGARGLWVTMLDLLSPVSMRFTTFAADQLNGASAAVSHDIYGIQTPQAVVKVGTSLASLYGTETYLQSNNVGFDPVFVAAGRFFLIGSGTANELISLSARFAEYI